MADTLVLPGIYANILSRPNTTLSASQTPSSLYPISRIANGRPSQVFIFPAVAADDYVQADINQVPNGTFEDGFTSGVPDGWTDDSSGTGAVAEETSSALIADGSGSGLQLTNGASGFGAAYVDVQFISGESVTLDTFAATDDGSEPATLEIQNLETGNYLTSGGVWQASQADVRTEAGTSLTQATLEFTLEAFSVTRRHLTTLRIRPHMDGVSSGGTQHNWDNILIYPGVTFASLHGHNLDPKVVPSLEHDKVSTFDSTDLTDEGDFTVDEGPVAYISLASTVYDRFWRVPQFTGTQSTATGSIEIGEAVLGQATTLSRNPAHSGFDVAYEIPQEELASRVSGEQWRIKHSKYRQRVVGVSFRHRLTHQTQFLNELIDRTNDGVDPVVVYSERSPLQSDLCVYGRKPAGATSFTTEGGEVDQTEITIVESPFGVVTD